MVFSFNVTGPIMGQPRPRATQMGKHIRLYDPANAVDYKRKIVFEAREELRRLGLKPPLPYDGQGLSVFIHAFYGIPKSVTKKERAAIESGELKPTKIPDADNIAKIVLDALNGELWHDDKEITGLSVMKDYAISCMPCLVVTICSKE